MESFNLKTIIHTWFHYESEDEENRPKWIENKVKNYNQGTWLVGREKCE